MSWIVLDDVVAALNFLTREELSGPVNVVSPQPVTNLEFTKTLGRVLRRPTLFPMPAFAARLAMGQMADELLLASARVEPTRLTKAGFAFGWPRLEEALRHVLEAQSAPETSRS
jgi:NAD dependent epimerase/dehydratase family enzyme